MDNAPAPVSCVHGLGCDEISVSGTSSVCVTVICMYRLRYCAVVVATAKEYGIVCSEDPSMCVI